MSLIYKLFEGIYWLPADEILAYVGPGLGAGALAVIFGLIATVFLAIFGLFWYPIKRVIKKIRPKVENQQKSKSEVESPKS